jgi:dihydroorotase
MNYLIKDIQVVNEGKTLGGDVLIKDGIIYKIGNNITVNEKSIEINGSGKYLLPGVIDDQVHFREPGLTHKATIYTESKAAVAGGVTGFMEMPNTIPPVFTQDLLEDKYTIAAATRHLPIILFTWARETTTLKKYLKPTIKKRSVRGEGFYGLFHREFTC